jgi:hypothetical protein
VQDQVKAKEQDQDDNLGKANGFHKLNAEWSEESIYKVKIFGIP